MEVHYSCEGSLKHLLDSLVAEKYISAPTRFDLENFDSADEEMDPNMWHKEEMDHEYKLMSKEHREYVMSIDWNGLLKLLIQKNVDSEKRA